MSTLKSLIEEHARLYFSVFPSTLLAIFHVINEKFPPARLLIYLVNKQAGWHFFPSLLVYSGLLFYEGLQSSKTIMPLTAKVSLRGVLLPFPSYFYF